MNIVIRFKSLAVKGFGLLLLLLWTISNRAYAQDPGGNPDGPPPAVPFDDYMNAVLMITGFVFALFVVIKRDNKKVQC